MKLEAADEETLRKIAQAWEKNAKRMQDEDRNFETLAHIIQNTDCQWYQVGHFDAWLYVRDILPGRMATLHALNLEGKRALDKDLIRAELLSIMREFDLRRLNVVVPSPVADLKGVLAWLGFIHEGRLRDFVMFDGRFTDSDMYSLLRREIEHDAIVAVVKEPLKERKTRRRRRSRRRKAKGNRGQKAQKGTWDKAPSEPVIPRPSSPEPDSSTTSSDSSSPESRELSLPPLVE